MIDSETDRVVPWAELCALIEPVHPKAGNGRPPIGLEHMLRISFLQHCFNLSNPEVEEALNDCVAMARFVGLDSGAAAVPDETTICKFRHLLEAHDLGTRSFQDVLAYLQALGLRISCGTIVDAPSSTKNASRGQRAKHQLPSRARRRPENCQRASGGKKLR